MWLIVGLGNPGRQYERTRHNVGFRILDQIVSAHGLPPFREKGAGTASEGEIEGMRVIAIKPLTYMNLSGPPVAQIQRFHKIPMPQIVVIHDDISLAPGKIRVKIGGGNGGHNGLKSLDSAMGASYMRLRVGVGHPGDKDLVSSYVLEKFGPQDEKWLSALGQKIVKNFPLILQEKAELFATKVMQP